MVWWSWFEAYAGCIGFLDALEEGGKTDMPATAKTLVDSTTAQGKLKEAAKNRNQLAMANLSMAFTSEGSMYLVYDTKDSDWPMGLAHKVTAERKQEYHLDNMMTSVELWQMLNKVAMKQKENPKTHFKQISAIKNWYNTGTRKSSKDDLIAIVLNAVPYEYQMVLTAVQMMYGNKLSLLNLKTAMNVH